MAQRTPSAQPEEPIRRVTILVPHSTWKEVSKLAIDNNSSLTEEVNAALTAHLKRVRAA